MKRFLTIFASIVAIFSIALCLMTGCVDGNVKKLKQAVLDADKYCPMNMGAIGDVLSIKYQQSENRVIITYAVNEEVSGALFVKENKDRLHKLLQLSFSGSDTQEILKDIVNAKASLMVIYKAPRSGKTVKTELTYDELKEMKLNPLSDRELQKLILDNRVELENATYPKTLDNGVIITKVEVIDNYLVYSYDLPQSGGGIKELKSHADEMKANIKKALEEQLQFEAAQGEFRMLKNLNMGYRYRYYEKGGNDYFDIVLTPEELAKYVR